MRSINVVSILLAFPFVILIWIYQKLISGLFPPCCMYYPSCSEYSRQAFIKHGFWGGCYLSIRRLLRCHPFHLGGVDEVPDRVSFPGFRKPEQHPTSS